MNGVRWLTFWLWVWTAAIGYGAAQAGQGSFSVEETLTALGNGPSLGSPDAPVSIVEFSDFQCSFCKKFWAETLPQLKNSFVQKGQVRFVYRHFAILGKHSTLAAQASECAGEQGKFWPYHDRLFNSQGGLAYTEAKLKQYARTMGLASRVFDQCLGSGKFLNKVEGETAVAAFLGARGTPTFFVNGRLLPGAQPFEVFQAAVSEELKRSVQGKERERR